MAIITISRQYGSFGTEIAEKVANNLKYEYVDKIKIGEAMINYGVPEYKYNKYIDSRDSIWNTFTNERQKFLHLLKAVIYDFANTGDVVIAGRGGQILLKDIPNVLNVRIITDGSVRTERIMKRENIDRNHAEKICQHEDRDSHVFIRHMFNIDLENQDMYDLIINTQKLSIDRTAELIIDIIQSPEFKERKKINGEKLSDLSLAQRVETELINYSDSIKITARDGVISLDGLISSEVSKKECEKRASMVEGVKKVENNISVIVAYGIS